MSDKILIFLLLIAAVMDVTTLKVRNELIVTGLFLGCLSNFYIRGPSGILFSLFGMMIPIAVFGIFYYFHMFGAGDIKLLSMAGAFLGMSELIFCLLPILIAAGILSFAKVLYERNLISRLIYLASYLKTYNQTKQVIPYYRGKQDRTAVIPLALPILIGVFLHMEGWI